MTWLLLVVAMFGTALSGCGGSATITSNTSASVSGNAQAPATTANPSGNTATGANGAPGDNTDGAGEVPVMPNLSEADVSEVTATATSAYSKAWSDGSGIDVVWGPNIVSGWAILSMENFSGASAKEVLLQKEGGAWVVRDMDNNLAAGWKDKTPAGLWP